MNIKQKHSNLIFMQLLLMCALYGCSGTLQQQSSRANGMPSLHWLLGDWVSDRGRAITYESWRLSDDATLHGVGRSESRETGQIKVTETLHLVLRDNVINFVATVAHNPGPVAFELVRQDEQGFVFENMSHDFPQRIVYQKLNDQQMQVTVSSEGKGGFSILFDRTDNAPALE